MLVENPQQQLIHLGGPWNQQQQLIHLGGRWNQQQQLIQLGGGLDRLGVLELLVLDLILVNPFQV